jgi:hypothetical protein
MKKFFYILILMAWVPLLSDAQMPSAKTNEKQSANESVNTSGFCVENSGFGYWVGRNSWGSFHVFSPNGNSVLQIQNFTDGSSFSSNGWEPGTYTATITNSEGTETTSFTVE